MGAFLGLAMALATALATGGTLPFAAGRRRRAGGRKRPVPTWA